MVFRKILSQPFLLLAMTVVSSNAFALAPAVVSARTSFYNARPPTLQQLQVEHVWQCTIFRANTGTPGNINIVFSQFDGLVKMTSSWEAVNYYFSSASSDTRSNELMSQTEETRPRVSNDELRYDVTKAIRVNGKGDLFIENTLGPAKNGFFNDYYTFPFSMTILSQVALEYIVCPRNFLL